MLTDVQQRYCDSKKVELIKGIEWWESLTAVVLFALN
jgi:hypothetical protein